jgi:hypothetical protein
VLVLPNGFDPELPHAREDYWAAKIKEIRAEKDEEDQSSAVSLLDLFNFFSRYSRFLGVDEGPMVLFRQRRF